LAQNNPAIAISPPSQLSDPTAELSVEEQLALEGVLFPPTDLYSDEPPLESDLHRDQIDLLLACLRLWWSDRNDYYASGNTTIYDNENQLTTRDFRGSDFFVVWPRPKLGIADSRDEFCRDMALPCPQQGRRTTVFIPSFSNARS
jgi:Uma2 family endonuclease